MLLVGGLLLFGLFPGVVDISTRKDPILDRRAVRGAVGIVEEGGEFVVTSCVAWFSLMIRRDSAA